MPDFLIALLKFGSTELPKILKRHLPRTVAIVAILTVAVQWVVIGPWGSDRLRNAYLSTLLTNEDDIEAFMKAAMTDKSTNTAIINGARASGFYIGSDAKLINEWEAIVSDPKFSDVSDSGKESAVQLARIKAWNALPPFQAIGADMKSSSPDCENERPPFEFIYFNDARPDMMGWKENMRVLVTNSLQIGRPVVAVLRRPPYQLRQDIQIVLNRAQYERIAARDEITPVKMSPTKLPATGGVDFVKTPSGTHCPNFSPRA